MNFYPHHIGDFNNATRHLARIERSVYRDLIDLYYDTEEPLTLDVSQLCRLVIARDDEERAAVEQVLNEFFVKTDDGWSHARCDQEIAKYRGIVDAKSAAGKASAAARASKKKQARNTRSTPVEQPLNGCSTNQEPLTINQEPEDQTPCAPPAHDAEPKADLFDRFWNLYPNKKNKSNARKAWAKLKVTDHLFDQIAAGLARYCASPDWVKDGGQFIPHPTTWLNGKRWEDEVALPTSNVHKFPGASRHSGFDDRDYTKGLTEREDGTYAF